MSGYNATATIEAAYSPFLFDFWFSIISTTFTPRQRARQPRAPNHTCELAISFFSFDTTLTDFGSGHYTANSTPLFICFPPLYLGSYRSDVCLFLISSSSGRYWVLSTSSFN